MIFDSVPSLTTLHVGHHALIFNGVLKCNGLRFGLELTTVNVCFALSSNWDFHVLLTEFAINGLGLLTACGLN